MRVKKPLFLLGAGFNYEAVAQLGQPTQVRYPLVEDLLDCFDDPTLPSGTSIEERFAEEIEKKNFEPLRRMVKLLEYSDYAIANLLLDENRLSLNAYTQFFDTFLGGDFLTFNYDGLAEIALLRRRSWTPELGFGRPVKFGLTWDQNHTPPQNRVGRVIHIHGSIYLRTDFTTDPSTRRNGVDWIEVLDTPRLWFDPGAAAGAFRPFTRWKARSPDDIEQRIIAPIPKKATLTAQPYIEAAKRISADLARQADPLVVIGYRFNPIDADSYDPILRAAEERVLIVAPDAVDSAKQIASRYPHLQLETIPYGFAKWVRSGYQGIECQLPPSA